VRLSIGDFAFHVKCGYDRPIHKKTENFTAVIVFSRFKFKRTDRQTVCSLSTEAHVPHVDATVCDGLSEL
jgi:hypothetical protein